MKKKSVLIILLCIALVCVCAISVYAAHTHSTAMGLYSHQKSGSGCIASERYYCDQCDQTLYVLNTTYNICPQWHRTNPNWQNGN
jgi:uncharacterized protein YpmB